MVNFFTMQRAYGVNGSSVEIGVYCDFVLVKKFLKCNVG